MQIVLQMLSDRSTPTNDMPDFAQVIMQVAPTIYFVARQAKLHRGAGFDVVWPQSSGNMVIGAECFTFVLERFRKPIGPLD